MDILCFFILNKPIHNSQYLLIWNRHPINLSSSRFVKMEKCKWSWLIRFKVNPVRCVYTSHFKVRILPYIVFTPSCTTWHQWCRRFTSFLLLQSTIIIHLPKAILNLSRYHSKHLIQSSIIIIFLHYPIFF